MQDAVDLIVRNGLIHDGTGSDPFLGDIAVDHGRIVEIGTVARPAREEIDAAGCIVTPGFVDIHTHYDGQLVWSNRLTPSSNHGVTTVVAGNCGLGFAPCRPEDRSLLVRAMEGVEDIPEAVMTSGLTWDWRTFPEFLSALENRPHDIDFGLFLPHTALRVYAMGERGANREPPTAADLAEMSRITREAMQAGAMGVSTSRIDAHRQAGGEYLPTFDSQEKELIALARAMDGAGRGVIECVVELQQADEVETRRTVDLLERISRESGSPVTFTLIQSNSYPERWREILKWVDEANSRPGVELRPQIFPRAVGMMLSHDLSCHPFALCPSYRPLANLPLAERLAELRKPEVRARLISETPADAKNPVAMFGRMYERMFVLGDPLNYEPDPEDSIAARARRLDVTPEEVAYDLLLEDDGRTMLFVGFVGYGSGSLDHVLDMTRHPDTIVGLGDGGAHYGMICDFGYTTFMLSYWSRDRAGAKLPLPQVIKSLTADTAELVGLTDRGRIAVGMKGDLNVIDYQRLHLMAPEVMWDLPGGGRRVHQGAVGYRWTIVSGVTIMRDGQPTAALPGRLVRRSRYAARRRSQRAA